MGWSYTLSGRAPELGFVPLGSGQTWGILFALSTLLSLHPYLQHLLLLYVPGQWLG